MYVVAHFISTKSAQWYCRHSLHWLAHHMFNEIVDTMKRLNKMLKSSQARKLLLQWNICAVHLFPRKHLVVIPLKEHILQSNGQSLYIVPQLNHTMKNSICLQQYVLGASIQKDKLTQIQLSLCVNVATKWKNWMNTSRQNYWTKVLTMSIMSSAS